MARESEFTLTLEKPLEIGGKSYDSIKFDLDKITGDDMMNAYDEMTIASGGRFVMTTAFNDRYCAILAAKCSEPRIDTATLGRLPGRKFSAIKNKVRSFFANSEL